MSEERGARSEGGAVTDTGEPAPAGARAAAAHPATDAALAAIYQDLILDHYRRPRNKGTLEGAAATAERRNPLCGDEIALAVAFDGDRVADARFTGRGCSISQASASMLTHALRGRTREEARALVARFAALMRGDAAAARDEQLGDLRALGGVSRFPARIRCATLAWSALDEILADPHVRRPAKDD